MLTWCIISWEWGCHTFFRYWGWISQTLRNQVPLIFPNVWIESQTCESNPILSQTLGTSSYEFLNSFEALGKWNTPNLLEIYRELKIWNFSRIFNIKFSYISKHKYLYFSQGSYIWVGIPRISAAVFVKMFNKRRPRISGATETSKFFLLAAHTLDKKEKNRKNVINY